MTNQDDKLTEYPIEFSWMLGAVLAQRRETLKLTQRAAAKIAGVAFRSYGEIERGVRVPRLQTLHVIAQALHFSSFMELLNTAHHEYERVYLKKERPEEHDRWVATEIDVIKA